MQLFHDAETLRIIDTELDWTVDAKNFYTRGSHSPFVGRKLKGRAVATVVRGDLMRLL